MEKKEPEVPFYETPEFTKVVNKLFEDLWTYYKIDKDILIELFYNRENEIKTLLAYLQTDIKHGENLLITGNAGVGKSNFVYRVITDSSLVNNYDMYPIFIDLHSQPDVFDDVLITFIKQMMAYYDLIGEPIHGIANTSENVRQNMTKIKLHLDSIAFERIIKKAIIFIDDMDYYEKRWYELLNMMLDFAVSPKASIVLAVRPFLEKQILSSFDTRIKRVFKKARIINLGTLNIENIITIRLACLMQEDLNKSWFKKLFTKGNPLLKLINHDISQYEKFSYLITNKLENFMKQVTNGNIREIYDIVSIVLPFILKNKSNQNKIRDENGRKKVVVEIDELIRLLNQRESRFQFINLHEYASKTKGCVGNSLLQNVLEAVELLSTSNEYFYSVLLEFGHCKSDVNKALQMLLKLHLVDEDFYDVEAIVDGFDGKRYYLTDKGRIYLYHISMWKEYCEKYGRSSASLFSVHLSNRNDPIIFDIAEFLQHLVYVLPPDYYNKFFIKIHRFYHYFGLKYSLKYQHAAEHDNCYLLDIEKLKNYVTRYMLTHENKMIVSNRAVNKNKYAKFAFLGSRVTSLVEELGLDKVDMQSVVDVKFYREVFENEIKNEIEEEDDDEKDQ